MARQPTRWRWYRRDRPLQIGRHKVAKSLRSTNVLGAAFYFGPLPASQMGDEIENLAKSSREARQRYLRWNRHRGYHALKSLRARPRAWAASRCHLRSVIGTSFQDWRTRLRQQVHCELPLPIKEMERQRSGWDWCRARKFIVLPFGRA